MQTPKNKSSLLVPIGFFLIFMIMGLLRLYTGIINHDSLHIVISAIGVALSVIGIIVIAGASKADKAV